MAETISVDLFSWLQKLEKIGNGKHKHQSVEARGTEEDVSTVQLHKKVSSPVLKEQSKKEEVKKVETEPTDKKPIQTRAQKKKTEEERHRVAHLEEEKDKPELNNDTPTDDIEEIIFPKEISREQEEDEVQVIEEIRKGEHIIEKGFPDPPNNPDPQVETQDPEIEEIPRGTEEDKFKFPAQKTENVGYATENGTEEVVINTEVAQQPMFNSGLSSEIAQQPVINPIINSENS